MQTDDATQTAFRYCCLGPVTLTGPDGVSLDLRTRKLLALILLLARQPGKPMSRDALIELLWPKDSERKARHSLSQSVSLINKALGVEAIASADKDRVVLRPNVLWLDANAFEHSAAEGDQAEARRLWRGTLLEGIWIQRAPGFERWLADERSRLERARRRVAHDIIEEARAEGDYQEMRAESESLLEMDALDEKAMLAFLEALQLAGDRTLALRRYTEFEKRLKEELDAEPGSALRGWARRNRKGDSEAGLRYVPIPRVSEITVLPSPQPIFGRVEEYALLWNAWEQTKTGKGAFIVLEGDAGIGKTALATKLANQVHVAGGSVCFVKCYRTEKSVPFAPATTLIRQLSRLPGFVALDPVWIGELTRLVPELRERYPNAPQPMAVDDAARHRLSDAIVQAALAVADEQPLLVVVDDLQDADEATLAALHYLGRQATQQPALFAAVFRSAEDTSGVQRAFLDTARRDALSQFIPFKALQRPDMERLILQVLARERISATDEVLDRIVRLSNGNPLQAIEAAVATASSDRANAHVESPQRILIEHSTSSESAFDLSVRERLQHLSSAGVLVAQSIAVAGRPLSGYELAAVTQLQIADMAGAIAELEGQQFIRRSSAGVGFAHERYVQAIEAEMDDAVRRRLHYELARLLQQSAAKNPAALYEVAKHYQASDHPKEARKRALAAARHAKSLGAVRERASALQLAMSVSSKFDTDLGVELGTCLLDLRDFEGLDRLFEASAGGNVDAESSAAFNYLRIAAAAGAGRANLPDTARELDLLLQTQPRFELEPAARTLLMRTAFRSGDFKAALRAARVLRRHRSQVNGVAAGHAYGATAYVAAKYYAPARALHLLRRGLQDAQARQDLDLEHLCRMGLGAVNRQLGRFREAIAEHQLALALARRTLSPVLAAGDTCDLAVAEMTLGNLERARALFEEAASLLKDEKDPRAPCFVSANHGELHLAAGRLEDAAGLFESALSQAIWLEDLPIVIQVCGGLALCAQRGGSQGALGHWAEELKRIGAGRERLFHERWLGEAAIAWDLALNHGQVSTAIAQLRTAANDLRRRDVDHWLQVELELLRIRIRCEGSVPDAEIESLTAVATDFEAGAVLHALKQLLLPTSAR
jgi:DNA-binding SARP family transcriptional activator